MAKKLQFRQFSAPVFWDVLKYSWIQLIVHGYRGFRTRWVRKWTLEIMKLHACSANCIWILEIPELSNFSWDQYFFEIFFLNWSYRPFGKCNFFVFTNYFKNIFIFNWEKFNLKNLLEFSSLVGSLCSKVVQNNQIYNIAFKIN